MSECNNVNVLFLSAQNVIVLLNCVSNLCLRNSTHLIYFLGFIFDGGYNHRDTVSICDFVFSKGFLEKKKKISK